MKRNIIILQIHVSMHSDLLLALTSEAALKEMKRGGGLNHQNISAAI